MFQNVISLFRQNQAKAFRQIKTDETEIILRQEKLSWFFLNDSRANKRGVGPKFAHLLSALNLFPTQGEGLIIELQRSLIEMFF